MVNLMGVNKFLQAVVKEKVHRLIDDSRHISEPRNGERKNPHSVPLSSGVLGQTLG